MEMNFPLLSADQIEVKVKQVTSKGAVLLLYKTARTDMELLDAVVGPMHWAVDYREIKGNLYCGIGITDDGEHWVWKWDCGIESRADGDGNEKKGEASDAFKRAGFKWGVGRELYSSPFTFAKVKTVQNGSRWELEDKFARFDVKDIGYSGRVVSRLVITDNHGQVVYSFGKGAMPVGSTEAAEEVGKAKLERMNAQQPAPPAEKPATAKRNTTVTQLATAEQKDMLRNMVNVEQLESCNKKYGDKWERMPANAAAALIAKIQREMV
jgi:hypothetical protein